MDCYHFLEEIYWQYCLLCSRIGSQRATSLRNTSRRMAECIMHVQHTHKRPSYLWLHATSKLWRTPNDLWYLSTGTLQPHIQPIRIFNQLRKKMLRKQKIAYTMQRKNFKKIWTLDQPEGGFFQHLKYIQDRQTSMSINNRNKIHEKNRIRATKLVRIPMI